MIFSILNLFLLSLVLSGGIFVTMKEHAPIWERLQVLAIGYMIFIGLLMRMFL